VPGALSTLGASAWAVNPASSPSSDWADHPRDSPYTLLVASPHSETTLAILGNTGVAIAVMTACLAAMEAFPRMRRLAGPVIAVGSMALTAYVLRIVGIQLLGIKELPGSPLHVLLGFIVAATAFAMLWSRFFSRGPLEWLTPVQDIAATAAIALPGTGAVAADAWGLASSPNVPKTVP
jgi:hypothetical protein